MKLPDFISANLEPILNEWETFAREIPSARDMNSKELRDHAKEMLETIVKDLATPQTEDEQKVKSEGRATGNGDARNAEAASEKHASGRADSGFSLNDMVSEYRALRASVLRLWSKVPKDTQQSDWDDVTRFNEAVDQALTESIARYSSIAKQAQDLFLGILGHDLRNPLGAMTMSALFLMRNSTLTSNQVKAATVIFNSGKKMDQLINDLLDFARTRLGRSIPIFPKETNLADIVEQAVAEAQAFHPDRTILFAVTGDVTSICDSARIGQVFSNLLGNALKHGGDSEPVTSVLNGGEKEIIAAVHNSGNPIPKNEFRHIFDPLTQFGKASSSAGQQLGLGLGLYIAQEIVQAHGGTIDVSSSLRDGTTFTVRFPRRRAS